MIDVTDGATPGRRRNQSDVPTSGTRTMTMNGVTDRAAPNRRKNQRDVPTSGTGVVEGRV
ncbi:hypothetical protein [Streptomyces sp. 6-11-2]|uniref:hypothetical protein n=1 Tax=Streptomyces sp. 6-11-2 TaxID=2585753 RepID=UPI0011431809|nr:hypothetical protein [Streptomyces sp. 6-11-2]GED87520.1 hypothetical protein TNCT6_46050 [Streptomyces sp. 6-11-2]